MPRKPTFREPTKADRIGRAYETLGLAEQIKRKAGIRPGGTGQTPYHRTGPPPAGQMTSVEIGGHRQ